MTPREVGQLTSRELREDDYLPHLGTHRALGKVTDVWLGFSERGLETVALSKVYGLFSTRQSPKRNLCTGGSSFFLQLQWSHEFQGATVFLDDELVVEDALSGVLVEVPEGPHVLRVETDAGAATKHVVFGPEDPGDRFMVLTTADLVGTGPSR